VGKCKYRIVLLQALQRHPPFTPSRTDESSACAQSAAPSYSVCKLASDSPTDAWQKGAAMRLRVAHRETSGSRGFSKLPNPGGASRASASNAYFGAAIRTRSTSWLASSRGMSSVSSTSFPDHRSLACWVPCSPNLAKSRWNGCVE